MATRLGIAYHDVFLLHGTEDHIESPARLRAIVRRLEETDWMPRALRAPVEAASREELEWLHDPSYVDEVRLVSQQGGGYLDLDTVATSETYRAACLAAGTSIQAVREVMSGRLDVVFCLVRPPGHHALPGRGMGFCFFNNAALAAEAAVRGGLERVAIVDWDLHHGNSTQEMFYHRGDVLYFSVHQAYRTGGRGLFYPGTGTVDEVGVDAGYAKNINVPLPGGATGQDFLTAFDQVLLPVLDLYQPQLIVVSAGFDAHYADPLGEMFCSVMAFHAMASRLVDAASRLCGGRMVFVLEGGYDLLATANSVEDCLRALVGEDSAHTDDLPPDPMSQDQAAVHRYLDHAIAMHRERLHL